MTTSRRLFFILLLMFFILAAPLVARANVLFQVPSKVGWGEPFIVNISSKLSLRDARLVWLDRTIPLQIEKNSEGYRATAILGTDVKYTKPGRKELAFKAVVGQIASELKRHIQVEPKKYAEQRLTVAQKMVTPSKKSLDRIRKESQIIGRALATTTPERYWSLPFVRPVKGGVSSEYGLRRFFNGQPRSPHRGVDLRGGKGTPIKATNAGRVLLTGHFYFGGNTVFIDHGQGLVSMYCHLSKINVRKGMMVSKGEVVGLIGMTGRVTGPHLHFSLYSARLSSDPLLFFKTDFGKE